MTPQLYITRTPDGTDFALPRYASKHNCGLRLAAAIPTPIKVEPGERVYIPTGFIIGIPRGCCGMIMSLPELVKEQGIIVLGSPQLVNPADREPLFIILQNASQKPVILRRGQLVAQLVITQAYQIAWQELHTHVNTEVTPSKDMLLDETDKKAEKPANPKREVKSIRSRFKAQDAVS